MKASVSRIIVMFFSILIFSLLWNGEDPLTHRQAFADEFDHDYFTANQNPETRHQLRENEAYHLNKGVLDDFNAKRFDIVIGEVKYILRRFPNHPQALMLLGSAAILKKEPSLAIPYYQRAISLYPQYAITHVQFGAYLIDIDQIEIGIARLNKAIKMDPKSALAYGRLAEAYYKNGDLELARQAAKQAKALGYKGEILSQILGE
jgi:tetratricopeptide (TPR) repeat protein